jgi:hypothetical protein
MTQKRNLFEVGFHARAPNTALHAFLPKAQHSLSINPALGGSVICSRHVEHTQHDLTAQTLVPALTKQGRDRPSLKGSNKKRRHLSDKL